MEHIWRTQEEVVIVTTVQMVIPRGYAQHHCHWHRWLFAPVTVATTSTSRSLMTTTKEVEAQHGPLALLKPAAIEIGIFAISGIWYSSIETYDFYCFLQASSINESNFELCRHWVVYFWGALTWIRAFFEKIKLYNSYKILKNFCPRTHLVVLW